jgi:hypothetical protein
VSTDLFLEQTYAMRRILGVAIGCDVDAFANEGVHVTVRPDPAPWPFTALIVGFGSGIVVSVEERYLEWAQQHAATTLPRANYLAIPLAAEGARRGETLHPTPPLIGWALTRTPERVALPRGYRLERVEKAWMDDWQRKDRFTNALGLAVQVHRTFRNQYA